MDDTIIDIRWLEERVTKLEDGLEGLKRSHDDIVNRIAKVEEKLLLSHDAILGFLVSIQKGQDRLLNKIGRLPCRVVETNKTKSINTKKQTVKPILSKEDNRK